MGTDAKDHTTSKFTGKTIVSSVGGVNPDAIGKAQEMLASIRALAPSLAPAAATLGALGPVDAGLGMAASAAVLLTQMLKNPNEPVAKNVVPGEDPQSGLPAKGKIGYRFLS